MIRESVSFEDKFERMRKKLCWFGLLSVLGLADSIWLLFLHAAKGSISAGCNLGPRISCDPVYVQEYSEWFGVPIPIFSILFFLVVLALVVWAYRKEEKHLLFELRPYAFLWLLGWIGMATTACMAYISMIFLRTFCPYCFLLWVVLGLFWLFTWEIKRALGQPWVYLDLGKTFRSPWFWGSALAGLAVLTASRFFLQPAVHRLIGTPVEIVGEESRSLGPVDAKISIVIFSDFQCPWCRVGSEVLRQLQHENAEKARVVFKFFPLDDRCNESVTRPMHVYSCAASVAAYCAGAQNQFWAYHDYLFTSQDELPEARLLWFARVSNLDLLKFDACRRDPRSMEEVRKNVREGISLGIQGTPAIFLNGQRYTGPITLHALRQIVATLR